MVLLRAFAFVVFALLTTDGLTAEKVYRIGN